MFDINDFMNAPANDTTQVVKRGSEEFTIRRLNGAERMRFNDIKGQYERVLFVLSRALLSGESKIPLGDANAAKFIERFGTLAEALFNDVFELTQKSIEEESSVWEQAKKNSESSEATNA